MAKSDLSIIVIGGLNTDIIALGAKKLLQAGEHTYAQSLQIGPGGKSRNIAQMIAVLTQKRNVAMIGKSVKDPYGLWKFPVDSLKSDGVNTDYVVIASYEESKKFPGIALIPVDEKGRNQIYVIPGINNDFLPKDIDDADMLFQMVAKNKGMLVLTLELPYDTAVYAVKKANKLGIKVFLDPGGIEADKDYKELILQHLYLIKPNEHEAKILTGVDVKDFESAKTAAEILLRFGIQNVFITLGSQGGYLFNSNTQQYIPVPQVESKVAKDETGCGDQTMAAFVYSIFNSENEVDSAKNAILAGTFQFYKQGIIPVTAEELYQYKK